MQKICGNNTKVLSSLIKIIKAQAPTMKVVPRKNSKKQAPKSQDNTNKTDRIKEQHKFQFGYKEYVVPPKEEAIKAKKAALPLKRLRRNSFRVKANKAALPLKATLPTIKGRKPKRKGWKTKGTS